jgi:hypothetical protein
MKVPICHLAGRQALASASQPDSNRMAFAIGMKLRTTHRQYVNYP